MLSVFFITSCSSGDDRETLSFNVPIKQIEDSIVKLNFIMNRLPTEKGSQFFKNCFIDRSGNWIINNMNMGIIDKINVDKVSILDSLTSTEKESLVSVVKFLNTNKITGCFRTGGNCYMYSYKEQIEDSYYDKVEIILKDLSCDYLFLKNEIIDSSGNLLLLKATH